MAELNPPLGTTTPEIFLDNVKRADELVNGPAGTVNDRAGEPLDTWRQMMAKNDEIRQNIIPLSKQYMTLTAAQADIANIPVNATTYVRSQDGSALATEYMNVAGTLTATGRKMLSQEGVEAGLAYTATLTDREGIKRQYGDYQDLTGLKLLDDPALMLPEDSVIELRTLATTSDVNTVYSRLVFSSAGSEVMAFVLPGTKTQYAQGKFWSAYRLFRFRDLKYVGILETTATLVRVRYDLPAGFGVPVAGSNYIALDLTGKFAPAQAGLVTSVTRKSISGTAIANAIQFVVTLAELTAAGFTAATVGDYLKTIAPDCLFAGYAAYDTTIAQTGFEDYFKALLPAGDYTVSTEGFTTSGLAVLPAGSYAVWRRKVVRSVRVGNYQRKGTDVKNTLSAGYVNYPVEIRVSFSPGDVPDSDALLVTDTDGNTFDAQFADDIHVNPRQKSNISYHADGSLAAGSVFILDSLSSGAQKYYEVKAWNRRRTDLASGSWPQLVKTADGYSVTVSGYKYTFLRQQGFALTSITDPAGIVHNITHGCYYSQVVAGVAVDEQLILGASIRLVNTGPVFTELEMTVRNRAGNTLAEGALMATVRYRLFRNGKVSVRVMNTAMQDIPVGVLFGVYSRLLLNDGVYTYDTSRALAYFTDATTGKRFTAALVYANGDVHRDGPTYGPNRPVRGTALVPDGAAYTRIDAGWRYGSSNITDYSFLNWPVKKGWTWTHELWIDCDNSVTAAASNATNALINSQALNRPVGFAGDCGYAGVSRQDLLEKMACHIRGSVEWWKSEDARQYGGGMPFINGEGKLEYPAFYCVPADIFLLARYGTGDLDTVYATFKNYMALDKGSIINPGAAYTGGWWGLQFQSRLSIPCYEWLYKMAVKAGDPAKITELKAGIKSLADAVYTYWAANGGIQIAGTATGIGASNANATGLRALALGIYTGQDSSGHYLTAFNAVEALLTDRNQFMKAEGILQDAATEYPSRAMYLHYASYAVNNYLLACRLLDRKPAFDLVNFILSATSGMGAFKEVDFCISESRRGAANTITFALLPLFFSDRPSALSAAGSLLDKLKTQYGPKPGFPKRFFGFDGTNAAGDTLSEISFVASTLSDLWLFYNQG